MLLIYLNNLGTGVMRRPNNRKYIFNRAILCKVDLIKYIEGRIEPIDLCPTDLL